MFRNQAPRTPFSASKKSIQSSNGAHFSSLLRWFSILKLTSFKPTSFRTGLATFNFSDIIDKFVNQPEEPKEEDKDKKTQKFSIDNFEIINSGVKLDDKFRGKSRRDNRSSICAPFNFQFRDSGRKPNYSEIVS